MRKLWLAPILALALAGAGCTKAYVQHPGSVNTFDSQSYDFLIATKAIIDQTRTDLANNIFTGKVQADVKIAENGLITAYDVADTAYVVYHTAAVAGTATAAQIQAVSTTQSQVQTATQALTNAKAGK